MQEDGAAESAGDIAQRRYRHYKTDVEDGERSQQGKECYRHHSHSQPHPRHTQSAQNDPADFMRPKALGVTDHFHRAGNAKLASGARDDNQTK